MIVSTVDISAEQLQVGDVILGEVRFDGAHFPWTKQWTITAIPPVPANSSIWVFDMTRNSGETMVAWPFNRNCKLYVERGVPAPAKTKHIDPYPGRCPLCGTPAYVSALAVCHKDENGASACTARRA